VIYNLNEVLDRKNLAHFVMWTVTGSLNHFVRYFLHDEGEDGDSKCPHIVATLVLEDNEVVVPNQPQFQNVQRKHPPDLRGVLLLNQEWINERIVEQVFVIVDRKEVVEILEFLFVLQPLEVVNLDLDGDDFSVLLNDAHELVRVEQFRQVILFLTIVRADANEFFLSLDGIPPLLKVVLGWERPRRFIKHFVNFDLNLIRTEHTRCAIEQDLALTWLPVSFTNIIRHLSLDVAISHEVVQGMTVTLKDRFKANEVFHHVTKVGIVWQHQELRKNVSWVFCKLDFFIFA